MTRKKLVSLHKPTPAEAGETYMISFQQLIDIKAEQQIPERKPVNFLQKHDCEAAKGGVQNEVHASSECVPAVRAPASGCSNLSRRLSRERAMKLLNVGKGSIYKLEALGRLTPRKLTGLTNSRVFYDRHDVERLLKSD